jgi:hypothetical protein
MIQLNYKIKYISRVSRYQLYWRSSLLRRKLSLIAITALCGIAIYIDTFYFFSPFNLKKSEVTQLTWKDTKYPLQVEYLTCDTTAGWNTNKISKNKEEIRYIIKSLEHKEFVTDSISEVSSLNLLPQLTRGKEYLIILRHINSFSSDYASESTVIFQFKFYQNDDYGTINNVNYFRLPQELREHIILQNEK